MLCPSCGKAKLIHDTRDVPYTYMCQSTVLPSVTGYFCSVCTEYLLRGEEVERVGELMLQFNQQVSASFVRRR